MIEFHRDNASMDAGETLSITTENVPKHSKRHRHHKGHKHNHKHHHKKNRVHNVNRGISSSMPMKMSLDNSTAQDSENRRLDLGFTSEEIGPANV